jgi:ABC-type phosphate transport system auxiliary subunit
MSICLVAAVLMQSLCAMLLAVVGLLLFTGMRGFHFMWFAVSNLRRSLK